MPQYSDANYNEFVSKAQGRGSGLGKKWHLDGALKPLGALLRKDSQVTQIVQAIDALSRVKDNANINKLRKYRSAIAYLERTFPIPTVQHQAPAGGSSIEAIRYVMNVTPPTATIGVQTDNVSGLTMSSATATVGLDMTVPEYMEENAANTRVLLIHLGTPQGYMNLLFDGISSLEHMNSVLRTAAANQIHVCVLCDPHSRGPGAVVPSAANAVCDGLRDAISGIPATHIKVADGGKKHSAFHDPTFQAWVTAPGVTAVVVLGYQADICVRGNVFGAAEELVGSIPRRIPPALINVKDVITSKPLLWADGGSIGAFGQWGMQLCGPSRD